VHAQQVPFKQATSCVWRVETPTDNHCTQTTDEYIYVVPSRVVEYCDEYVCEYFIYHNNKITTADKIKCNTVEGYIKARRLKMYLVLMNIINRWKWHV